MTVTNERVKKSYHHGDLRTALLEAGEIVLAEKGVEGFTLRGVARAAGVSHSAPAHHFKSVTHFLTDMTVIAFERLRDALNEARSAAGGEPQAELRAASVAYFRFAKENPQHFRLMWRSNTVDHTDGRVQKVGREAFAELVCIIGHLESVDDVMSNALAKNDVFLVWSVVQGYSYLVLEEQIADAKNSQDGLEYDERLLAMIERVIPALATAKK